MVDIFSGMKKLAVELEEMLSLHSEQIERDSLKLFPWHNKIFRNKSFRRGHIEVLDVIESKKMWIMHICIFPHLDDSSPIYGFDVICGANKITGIFHDFSITSDKDHPMVKWFAENAGKLTWKKDRELPEWGKRIFSPHMIAAGNVNTDEELEKIITFAKKSMEYYLSNVGRTLYGHSFVEEHNKYCVNQKENIHTSRFLINCGYTEEEVKLFINRHLFPEIKY